MNIITDCEKTDLSTHISAETETGQELIITNQEPTKYEQVVHFGISYCV